MIQMIEVFLRFHNIRMITLEPNSLWLNHAEEYIYTINLKIRTKHEMNKLLTETMFRIWVSKTSTSTIKL